MQGGRLLSEAATSGTSISLANLIALNDEIAALVRARVPLEEGLTNLGRELPGRLGHVMTDLGARLSRGETLPQAISANQGEFPPVYRAVVEAGLASGRLPVVLEALTRSAQRIAELRRVAITAVLYPLCVLEIAFGLFSFYLFKITPQLFDVFGDNVPAPLRWMEAIKPFVRIFGPYIPVAIALAFLVWWYRSSKATVVAARPGRWWWPSLARLSTDSNMAAMSEILALLLEHGVPLPEALELATRAVGNKAIAVAGEKTAAAIRTGVRPKIDSAELAPFPPLMRWILATGERLQTLAPLLRHAAANYRTAALRQADWIRLYLPVILLVLLGGVTTAVYAITLYLPWAQVLEYVADPRFVL